MDDPYATPVTREVDVPPRRKWVGDATLRSVGVVMVMFVFLQLAYRSGLPTRGTWDDYACLLGAAIAGVYGFNRGGWKWQLVIAIFVVLWITSQVHGAMKQVEREGWPDFPGVPTFPGWMSFAESLVPEVIILGCAMVMCCRPSARGEVGG